MWVANFHFLIAVPTVADDDDPTTPTAHNGAAGDTDEEAGVPSAVETGAGSPDTHGGSFAMRGASAMKQIRAPLEALFKRRGSTAPGGMTRERDGEGGTTSGGGGLPSGLDARRTALLATLHGSSGGLPAGKYVVEVDQSGEWLSPSCKPHIPPSRDQGPEHAGCTYAAMVSLHDVGRLGGSACDSVGSP